MFGPVVLSYRLLEARQKLLPNSATDRDWTDLDENIRGVHGRETGRAAGHVLQARADFDGLDEYTRRRLDSRVVTVGAGERDGRICEATRRWNTVPN